MTMTLNESTITETKLSGSGVYNLAAGEELKIEAPEEILSVEPAEGKAWAVTIVVSIIETDV